MSKENGEPPNAKRETDRSKPQLKKALKPVNELEVKDPGTSGETLKQQKIRTFFEKQEAFRKAKYEYYTAYQQVAHLIMAGAEIQPGRFGVKYGVKNVRRRSYKQDLIDAVDKFKGSGQGEAYQIRLLESTQPYAQFYVRIRPPKP